MAGIIWFDEQSSVSWVAENWLYEALLSDAIAHFRGDAAICKTLQAAKRSQDLKLDALARQDVDLCRRLREGLRAVAVATLERGSDAKGGTKKYLDDIGQASFLDKIREYLDRDQQSRSTE